MKNRGFKGFTIIELLVVCAIIGLLAALLLPALGRARKATMRGKCVNNLKQMGSAFTGFAGDYGEFPWMLPWREAKVAYAGKERDKIGNTWGDGRWWFARNIEFMWMAVSDDLRTVRTLLSPCDPACIKANDDWYAREQSPKKEADYGVFGGRHLVENYAQSYSVHKGGSAQSGNSILALTKNTLGADPRTGQGWHLSPNQAQDLDGDGNYDEAGSWGLRKRGHHEIYYHDPNVITEMKKGPVSGNGRYYQTNPMAGNWDYDGWDDFLCVGNNSETYDTKEDASGSFVNYDANAFIGPTVSLGLTYKRDTAERSVYHSLMMYGLDANQGHILKADGSVTMANDVKLKEMIKAHAQTKGSWPIVKQTLSQATRDMPVGSFSKNLGNKNNPTKEE